MEAASTQHPAAEEDIDLTGAAPIDGGPNAPHANADEEETWPEPAAAAEPSADAGAQSAEAPPPSAPEPEPEPERPEPTPPSGPAAEATGADDGDAGGETARKSSGAQKRAYTLLEEQAVVRVGDLTDAQRKSLESKAVTGYVVREGKPVIDRNADVVLERLYPDEESVPAGVTAVLPLSERNFHPVVLNFEPVQKSRLKLNRR